MLKRCATSFAISVICGAVVNILLELFVGIMAGVEGFTAVSPAFLDLFPNERIAAEVNILLYGIIGAAFSGATFIYEKDRIGFLLQNLIYLVLTGVVWIPIVAFIWQLQQYPSALIGTIMGFVGTYVIMTIVGYNITKKEVAKINSLLEATD